MIGLDGILKDADTIGISGHTNPDGDCIGSCMGMYLTLRERYPEKTVQVFLDPFPEEYLFIPGADTVIHDGRTDVDRFDVFIVLDSGKERIGDAEKLFDGAKVTVNIDHHLSNPGTGDHTYIVPEASSASELVCDVLGTDDLPADAAIALYMGIVTDTGVFKYSNTSTKTMRIAGELLKYGFDQSELIDRVFFEKTYRQNLILGRALLESVIFMDGRCVFSCITARQMDFYRVDKTDLDGIVSQLNLTKDVECAIFMYETGTQQYKVSLRSKGKVNVAKIAEVFGGGGHARAAGCTMTGTVHDVVNSLSRYIEADLQEAKA